MSPGLVSDLKIHAREIDQMSQEMNRREFVTTVAAVAAGACLACCGDLCDAAAPAAPGAASGNKLDAGAVSDYANNGLFDKFCKSDRVIIAREGDKIRAIVAVCTHKGTTVTVKGAEIVCPKHNSHFAADGNVTKGPATAALFHHPISKNDEGHLIVDKSKKLGANELNDPSSFVKVA
jgi:nitrite reductase/ring-hydroxylating ferredoxin subunit